MAPAAAAAAPKKCMIFGRNLLGKTLQPDLLFDTGQKLVPVLEYLKANTDLAPRVIFEYGRFLLLKVMLQDTNDVETARLYPSTPVASVWRAHMLIPQHYKTTCATLCGHVICYHPNIKTSESLTRRIYAAYFGQQPPKYLWPIARKKRTNNSDTKAAAIVPILPLGFPIVQAPPTNLAKRIRVLRPKETHLVIQPLLPRAEQG